MATKTRTKTRTKTHRVRSHTRTVNGRRYRVHAHGAKRSYIIRGGRNVLRAWIAATKKQRGLAVGLVVLALVQITLWVTLNAAGALLGALAALAALVGVGLLAWANGNDRRR